MCKTGKYKGRYWFYYTDWGVYCTYVGALISDTLDGLKNLIDEEVSPCPQ